MRDVLASGGLRLAQTAVTHFGDEGALDVNADYDYEYVLDCKPMAHGGPLALALSNFTVQLRNRETLALETEFHAHNSTINELWTSATAPWSVATCSSDTSVKFWDLRASTSQPAIAIAVNHEAWSLDVGRDDTLLAVGTDVQAHFFDLRTSHKMGEYGESHVDAVTQVRFHPVATHFVVTASEDGVVSMFDTRIADEDDAVESIVSVESAVTKIGFFGHQMANVYVLTGSETLDLWNLHTAERLHHYATIRDDCNAHRIATDYLVDCVYDTTTNELFVVAGSHDGTANVVHVATSGAAPHLRHAATLTGGHKACIRSMYYDPVAHALFTGGEDARLCKWSPSSNGVMGGVAGGATASKLKTTHDIAGLKKARKSSRPY